MAKNTPRRGFRNLSLNQKLTLIFAVASLCTGVASVIVATVALILVSRQLTQTADLFAIQQRPLVELAYTASGVLAEDHPTIHAGELRWNYAFKNLGVGQAYDLVLHEGVSAYGRPFREHIRKGGELAPGAMAWGTGTYFFRPGELPEKGYVPAPLDMSATLRVRFNYRDALGRTYQTISCRRIGWNGTIVNCSNE